MRTLAFVVSAVLGACAGGGDDPSPAPDAPQSNVPVCGDGTCAAAEVGACPQDCGGSVATCGNLTCDAGETAASCPNDCQTGAVCGDSQCDMANGENSTNCPGDCTGGGGGGTLDCNDQNVLLTCITCIALDMCTPPATLDACNACLGGGGGGGGFSLCDGGTPDGVCDAAAGEDSTTCPEDCQ